MDNLIYWGEILKEARTRRHLTQKEVADVLHMSRQAYSNYETGRLQPPPEVIAIMSNVYDFNFFDHILKYMPADYIAEQHEFKTSIPASPDKPAGSKKNIRKKSQRIYPDDIELDD